MKHILKGVYGGILSGLLGLIIGSMLLGNLYWIMGLLFLASGFFIFFGMSKNQKKYLANKKSVEFHTIRLAKAKADQKELIVNQYGKPIIERDSRYGSNSFSVHEESKVIIINNKPMPYSDIRACELFADSQTSSTTTSTTTKSSTGSVVGRAVVGTIVAGGAGAIIGGLSGEKTGIGETTTNTITNYSVRISTNNIAQPTKIYKCNDDIVYATNLVDTINIIIERLDKDDTLSRISN